jgi:hypothetical protein
VLFVKHDRVCVPVHLRQRVLAVFHENNGHVGRDKLADAISIRYYWPRLHHHVYDHVANCKICNLRNMQSIKCQPQEVIKQYYPLINFL